MVYYISLFSPETHEAFTKSTQTISGFRKHQLTTARKIKPGDKLICYVTKISRWAGVFEVESECFEDSKPIFYKEDDPFTVRFKVKPVVWLPLENCISIHEDLIWNSLSFTKELEHNNTGWTGKVRGSLAELKQEDGRYLEKILLNQNKEKIKYELTEEDIKKIKTHKVRTQNNKELNVSIPDDASKELNTEIKIDIRESIQIQAKLAQLGEKMGFSIWLPKSDRSRVLELWTPEMPENLLDILPMNYDEVTIKTIEQIDVLWIKRRSIVRAFEVEHTTAIYSGILRMADLMALQPNLDIKAHIVAPSERKEKVFQEIKRPVFTLLEKDALYKLCTFIAYDSILSLNELKHLTHMSDSVLDEYVEEVED